MATMILYHLQMRLQLPESFHTSQDQHLCKALFCFGLFLLGLVLFGFRVGWLVGCF